MSNELQRRIYEVESIRAAAKVDGKPMRISGLVVPFNKRSHAIFDMFYEVVSPGAFQRSIEKDVINSFWEHKRDMVLASTKNDTLLLTETSRGLEFQADLPETTWGLDAYRAITGGYVDSMSFAFTDADMAVDGVHKKLPVMRMREATLKEVSPVSDPQYPGTKVSARSFMEDNGYQFDDNGNIIVIDEATEELKARALAEYEYRERKIRIRSLR